MSERIAEIRARLEAATPGPWEWDWSTLGSDVAEVAEPRLACGQRCIGGTASIDIKAADAQLIANAPEDIAWLIGALDRVREIHSPVDAVMFAGGRQHLRQVCTGCGTDDGNWQIWPCPTIRAIKDGPR